MRKASEKAVVGLGRNLVISRINDLMPHSPVLKPPWKSRFRFSPAFALVSLCATFGQAAERMGAEVAPKTPQSLTEQPYAPRYYSKRAADLLVIELPSLVQKHSKATQRRTGPREIGIGRELPKAYLGNLTPLLTWRLREDGGYVASVEVKSPGAQGLRAGIRALASDSVEIRFYDPSEPTQVLPPYVPKAKTRLWENVDTHWSPTTSSDRLMIEIHAPNWSVATTLRLEITRVSHLHRDPRYPPQMRSPSQRNSNSCDAIPAACGTSSSCALGATAKVSFVSSDGNAYVCSGTIINDDRDISDKQNAAYLHTAYHCIGSQGVASSLEAEFHYGFTTCNGTQIDERYARHYGGADLLEALPQHDQSLVRLRRPLSINGVCFSGWDASRTPEQTPVLGVHHPGGRHKEWVEGKILDYASWSFKEGGNVNVAVVEYSQGHTQGGSSGSGLFLNNGDDTHYLLGALAGGPDENCTIAGYGSLSEFYPRIRHHLRNENPPAPADDHGNSRSSATSISVNTAIEGQLESPDDVDYFEFTVDGNGRVTIESMGFIDTIGTLYDGEGRELLRDDDGGDGYNFSLSKELASGTYYLSVVGYDGEVGNYSLSIQFVAAPVHSRAIPFMLAADESGRQGFLRIQNYSENTDIDLQITGIDDWGTKFGPIHYPLEPLKSIHFNSNDIEKGNTNKGLIDGLGDGRGSWRLQLQSSTPIYATSYVRTSDGFLTSIHDTALDLELDETSFLVPIFNPASNVNQRSILRITNLSSRESDVSIFGLDDAGQPGLEAVGFRLEGKVSVHLDADSLENGIPNIDAGHFGDGKGKWQLVIETEQPTRILSLMVTPNGHITNLSTINPAIPHGEERESRSNQLFEQFRQQAQPRKGAASRTLPRLLPNSINWR